MLKYLYDITPYWVAHAGVALIFCCFFGWSSGMVFYAGREIAQYEEKGYFDWKGFLAPVIVSIIWLGITTYRRTL